MGASVCDEPATRLAKLDECVLPALSPQLDLALGVLRAKKLQKCRLDRPQVDIVRSSDCFAESGDLPAV